MKAIAIIPEQKNAFIIERSEPQIKHPDEIKLRILQVGICGTDREEVKGGRADAPPGSEELIIGHENFGIVVETGDAVTAVKPGDYAMFSVRRDCEVCVCGGYNDMCPKGEYTERGIKGRDGFQAEYVVDVERYIVKIPEEIKTIGVLAEPMSVSEKAINECVRIQCARIPGAKSKDWLKGKTTLVAGLGSIGLLAAFILRLRGADVLGLDIVDEDTLRPSVLKGINGTYIDGRKVNALNLDKKYGHIDLIFEATGVPKLEFNLIDALGINGIYVLTGIPAGSRPININGAMLIQQLVLKNQIMLGSVNAGMADFNKGIEELLEAHHKYPEEIHKIITDKIPVADFQKAFDIHNADSIKTIIEWQYTANSVG